MTTKNTSRKETPPGEPKSRDDEWLSGATESQEEAALEGINLAPPRQTPAPVTTGPQAPESPPDHDDAPEAPDLSAGNPMDELLASFVLDEDIEEPQPPSKSLLAGRKGQRLVDEQAEPIRTAHKGQPIDEAQQRRLWVWVALLAAMIVFGSVWWLWPAASVDQLLRERRYPKALAILLERADWVRAAEVYKQLGQYPKALEIYDREKMWVHGAKLCIKLGQWEKASKRFEIAGDWTNAAIAAKKAKQYVKAAKFYEKEKQYPQAIALYAKKKMWLHAAKLSEDHTKPEDAIGYYERAKRWDKAGDLSFELKQYRGAARYYKKANLWLKQSQALLMQGDLEAASKLFEEKGFYRCAASVYQQRQKYRKASKLYRKAAGKRPVYDLMVLAAKSAELGRRIRSTRKILKIALEPAYQYHQYFSVFDLHEQMGKGRTGERIVRKVGKQLWKAGEFWLLQQLFTKMQEESRLSLAEKLPFSRRLRKLKKVLVELPRLESLKHQPLPPDPKAKEPTQEPFTGITLHAKISTPLDAKAKKLYLACSFFHKDFATYAAKETEGGTLDVCKRLQGPPSRMETFEKAPSGRLWHKALPTLEEGKTKTFTFTLKMDIPYQQVSCWLQRTPALELKKRKRRRKRRRRRRKRRR